MVSVSGKRHNTILATPRRTQREFGGPVQNLSNSLDAQLADDDNAALKPDASHH